MSCNGCRVLRKGCSDSCVLRPCLQWIPTPESQGHATVFVAKFFGRAGLMSFISNVPDSQRPALFQSLLYEACGRTVNPVSGAVGLLWTGNWQICQAAVDTVLRGRTLRPSPDFLSGIWSTSPQPAAVAVKRQTPDDWSLNALPQLLDPILTKLQHPTAEDAPAMKLRQPATPSLNSEESGTTNGDHPGVTAPEPRLLNLFV